jgi:hypothetical protein
MLNPWIAIAFRAAQMGAEAQSVIALRMLRLAAGGRRGEAEATRMVIEKVAAAAEANVATVVASIGGRPNHVVANRALRLIRKRARANKRRLSRR